MERTNLNKIILLVDSRWSIKGIAAKPLTPELTLDETSALQRITTDQLIDDKQLDSSEISDELKEKVKKLLGMKFSLELEKMAQRGVTIIFLSKTPISNHIIAAITRLSKKIAFGKAISKV